MIVAHPVSAEAALPTEADPLEMLEAAFAAYRAAVLEHEAAKVAVASGAWPSDLARARCLEVEARLEVKKVLWADTLKSKVKRSVLEATGECL